MFKSVGKLFGIRRKAAPPKSRIDRRKTRVNMLDQLLDDSDEGSCRSTTSVSSGSEYCESDDDGSDSSYRPKRDSDTDEGSSSDAGGQRVASRGRPRKRAASTAALQDTDSSDVGSEKTHKAQQKKRLKLPDSEDEALNEKKRETELKEAKEAAAKRRERKTKLMELARRRNTFSQRRRRRTLVSVRQPRQLNFFLILHLYQVFITSYLERSCTF